MKQFTFRGFMAPVFTAFNSDKSRSLNTNIIPEYASYLASCKIKGVLVNGTTGEGTLMTVEEREQVTEAWAKACKINNQCLMIQVGGTNLVDVQRLAAHAEQQNVDALLCLPELFHKPITTQDLIDYLHIVSNAAPNTPLLYYHYPDQTTVNIKMDEFLSDAHGKIPTLVGIKFTSSKLDEGAACLKAGDGSYTIFLGNDKLISSAIILGIDSAINTTFNIIPSMGQQILQNILDNKLEKAKKSQDDLTAVINTIIKNGSWVATMKVAMNLLTPIKVGVVRPPLKQLTKEQITEMKTDLKKLGIYKD